MEPTGAANGGEGSPDRTSASASGMQTRRGRRGGKPVADGSDSDDDAAAPVVGKNFPTYFYTDMMVKYPTLFVSVFAFIPLVLAVVSLGIDINFENSLVSFAVTGLPVTDNADLFSSLQSEWNTKLLGGLVGSATTSQANIKYRVYVNYEIDMAKFARAFPRLSESQLDTAANMLRSDNLKFMLSVESAISRLTTYQRVCYRSPTRGADADAVPVEVMPFPRCTPFESVLTYYYIGDVHNHTGKSYWDFDGLSGLQQLPAASVEDILFADSRFRWFMDWTASTTRRRTRLLRTQINLGTPLVNRNGNVLSAADALALYDAFISDFINVVSRLSHDYITVTYGGDRIFEVIVDRAIASDSLLVALPAILVFFVMWYHFHSFILALMGLFHVVVLQPAATVIYAGVAGRRNIPMLFSLAFYVSCLLALDAMLIFFDTFRHSGIMITTGKRNLLSISQRLAFAYRKAGVGISVSAFVAFLCFLVATSSSIAAVKAFSQLLVVVVCLNWALMLTYFPSAVMFHHFHISKSRRNLQRQKEILLNRSERRRDSFLADFLRQHDALRQKHNLASYAVANAYLTERLEEETTKKQRAMNIWAKLNITRPVKAPNPFGNSRYTVQIEEDGGSVPAVVDQQAFLDQFADIPQAGRGTAVADGGGGGPKAAGGNNATSPLSPGLDDPHLCDISDTFHVTNMTPETMLDFDDSRLRFQLIATGRRTPGEFLPEELKGVAPVAGVMALGKKAEERLASMMRTVITLMYGEGRTLKRIRIARPLPAAAMGPNDMPPGGPPSQQPSNAAPSGGGGLLSKFNGWWASRQGVRRKWCCGLLGERVDETEEQRDARIMAKDIKQESFNILERFLSEVAAPGLHYARFCALAVSIAILITAAVLTSFVTVSSTTPVLLNTVPTDIYPTVSKKFAETGACDRCSAYHKRPSDFPQTQFEALTICAQVFTGQLMFARVDQCGECFGTDACVDCQGVPRGTAQVDTCGQCLQPGDTRFNVCPGSCVVTGSSMECSYCRLKLAATVGRNGPLCGVSCDNTTCPSNRGKCNTVTGRCECHFDRINGFWVTQQGSSENCNVCATGYYGSQCQNECNPQSTTAASAPCRCWGNSTCTSCAYAMGGPTCQVRNYELCAVTGTPTSTACVCQTGYGGPNCAASAACNFRGIYYNSSVAPFDGCACYGQFRGPQCTYCACFNGGTCNSTTGACICVGPWTGTDCRTCAPSCSSNGACPVAYNASHYSVRQCRALYCSDEELASGPSTALCRLCTPPNGTSLCQQVATQGGCVLASSTGCEWDSATASCVSNAPVITPPSFLTRCECRGRWSGSACAVCNTSGAPSSVTCNAQGVLVGCDNQPAVDGVFKVIDNCGQCGGSTSCRGCDGIVGSTKVLDSCGVCGGNNDCKASTSTETVYFIHGLSSNAADLDMTNTATQIHLLAACTYFRALDGQALDYSRSTCVMSAFNDWLLRRGLSLPLAETSTQSIHSLAFQFVQETGRYSEIGFTTATASSARIRYVVNALRTTNVRLTDSQSSLSTAFTAWSAMVVRMNNPTLRGRQPPVQMVSNAWVHLYTLRAAAQGTAFTLTTGLLMFFVVALSATCSITLTLTATFALSCNVFTVLALFYLAGYQLGVVERVSVTFLMGIASEQLIHMAEAYLEHLHASQSHLFARETTRLQSIQGMFRRVGQSLILSTVTLTLCSCFLFAAQLLVYRRVAAIVIIVLLSSLFHCFFTFAGCLSALGPTVAYRNWRTSSIAFIVGTTLFLILFLSLWQSGTIELL